MWSACPQPRKAIPDVFTSRRLDDPQGKLIYLNFLLFPLLSFSLLFDCYFSFSLSIFVVFDDLLNNNSMAARELA